LADSITARLGKIESLSYIPSILESTGNWFLHSGIQEPCGGVARYYSASESRNKPVSTEITGYYVSAMVYLFERTARAEYLDAAARAARFLTRQARKRELKIIPFELAPDSPAYFFDCGIIARGLLSIHAVTNEDEYLETAVECGTTMGERFRNGGDLHPILAMPTLTPFAYEPRWSRSPGCYQLKSAMAWHNLFEATGETKFRDWYEKALEAAIGTHESFLPGEENCEKVMDRLHAYSYFLEGMLPAASRQECQQAYRRGLAKAASLLREIGPLFRRSDACAQVLRARLRCGIPIDHAAAEEEAAWCRGFQYHDGDARHRNGFSFGSKGGSLLPFVNPVSAAFCMQALDEWETGQPATESRLI
jgi:hypothetical protein